MTARIGVIGAGSWARFAHLPEIVTNPDLQLAGIADPDIERARRAAADFGTQQVFANPLDLLQLPQLDAVLIATPHATHAAIAEAALLADLHVLIEKPLTLDAAAAWHLVDLASARKRHLSIGYTYQYAAPALAVKDAIAAGRIGKVVAVAAEFASATAPLFAGAQPSAHGQTPDQPDMPHVTTYADPALAGGGQAVTQLTHILGCMLWTLNLAPRRVSAYLDRQGLKLDVINAVAFELDGGTIGTALSTGTNIGRLPARHRIVYYGTDGMIEHDLLGTAQLETTSGTAELWRPDPTEPVYPVGAPVRHFGRLIDGDGPNLAPGENAAHTVALIEAIYAAASDPAQGRMVSEPPTRQP